MDEQLQRYDTALFGPWRAFTAVLTQHAQALALIQMQVGQAWTGLALREFSLFYAPIVDSSQLAARVEEHTAAVEALQERLNEDSQRLIDAHRDLLNTTGVLTGDSLACIQSVAAETAENIRPVAKTA
jgi:hypothetical protein